MYFGSRVALRSSRADQLCGPGEEYSGQESLEGLSSTGPIDISFDYCSGDNPLPMLRIHTCTSSAHDGPTPLFPAFSVITDTRLWKLQISSSPRNIVLVTSGL